MNVVALKKFQDFNKKKIREAGEVFEASQKRLDEINSTDFGILAAQVILPGDEPKEEPKDEPKEEKTKTTAAPKKGKK